MKISQTQANLFRSLCCQLLMLFFVAEGMATTVQYTASADTTITRHPKRGSGHSPLGSSTTLVCVSRYSSYPDNQQWSQPLVKFDLSNFAGKTVVGDTATISVRIDYSWHYYLFPDWQQVNLHKVLVNWDETSAMYDDFGGSSGISGKYSPTVLSSRTIYQSDLGNYISWTVPVSIIQGWIDNPSLNYGLMFVPPGYNQCEYEFSSKESGFSPILSFEIIPEPVSLTLFSICGLALRHRRNS